MSLLPEIHHRERLQYLKHEDNEEANHTCMYTRQDAFSFGQS